MDMEVPPLAIHSMVHHQTFMCSVKGTANLDGFHIHILYYTILYPPTPAYSQSLGGEAPGPPQGEAVGQA